MGHVAWYYCRLEGEKCPHEPFEEMKHTSIKDFRQKNSVPRNQNQKKGNLAGPTFLSNLMPLLYR
jgi:hypothetical protein